MKEILGSRGTKDSDVNWFRVPYFSNREIGR